MPPPIRLRHTRAGRCARTTPTSTEPTGAPRPLDRQTDTVSATAPYSVSGTPSATCAFQSRAPSRCTATPASAVPSRTRRSAASGCTVPPPKLWVFSTATAAVDTRYGPAVRHHHRQRHLGVEQADLPTGRLRVPGAGGDARGDGVRSQLGPHDVSQAVAQQLLGPARPAAARPARSPASRWG